MPEVISFARGAPSADILPAEVVRAAADRALTDDWERALSYGKGAGHPGLCEWVAQAHAGGLGGVAREEDGIDVGALEAALADASPKLVHVIPNFHNPAGCTLSEGKRTRLVELAAEHGFTLFEGDPHR